MTSPNFDSRDGQIIDMIVLHYTGMPTAQAARERMCDPAAKVSAHYLVDEDGGVQPLVDESMRAWHAGVSFWRGNTNINQRSIGIEIVNPGHEFGYRPFPHIQMQAVATLCKDILTRHAIAPRNIVAHSDIAPSRKEDPGELFDWKWLAKEGVGLWPAFTPSPLEGEGGVGGKPQTPAQAVSTPHPNLPVSAKAPTRRAESLGGPEPWRRLPPQGGKELEQYGYDTTDLPKAITAFQRHFRPKSLTGQWDSECAGLLASLLAMV